MSFLVGRVVLQFALLDVNSGHQMIWTLRTGLDWTKPTLSEASCMNAKRYSRTRCQRKDGPKYRHVSAPNGQTGRLENVCAF